MAQVETEDGALQLTITYATSGDALTQLRAPATSLVSSLKKSLMETLGPRKVVGKLLLGDTLLQESRSLQECGLTDGAEVKIFLHSTSKPKLLIDEDIACFGSDDEPFESDEEGDEDGDAECLMRIDAAPEIAREVAKAMMAELGDVNIACGSENVSPGVVAVIANPGDKPRKACLRALKTPKTNDRLVGEYNDKENEDGENEPPLWTIAACDEKDWGQCLEGGFDGSEKPEIVKVTKIMSEKLEKHFEFGFKDAVVVAPIFYGGYASDGNIVGVLTSRVWT